MNINTEISISSLKEKLDTFWRVAAEKAELLDKEYDPANGSPVFTIEGKYTTRGWTEWTQGFQYGIPILIFEATDNESMLEIGRKNTFANMAHHISHFGVHDHGFNNLSTYGNLLRNANTGKFDASQEEKEFYKLAISISGAVQARRWSTAKDGGFIYSFNGPHSLFIDTIRSCRILLASHKLGHRMLEEGDEEINLLGRAITHGMTTAKYGIYYGEGRDSYDVWGRTAHESVFNMNDGNYRCPNSQQGFSGFTTWTRGLAWAMLGYPEFLEFLDAFKPDYPGLDDVKKTFLKAAQATNDFFIDNTALDGIPYWDTGAPEIHKLGKYQDKLSDPYNDFEPVDSSAAAIGAQGLLRLGKYLEKSNPKAAAKYFQAGLSTLDTLLSEPYLSTNRYHQGILLHSVYHRPNGWDHIPEGAKVPCGESSMWGDYHMTELCLTAKRLFEEDHYTFFGEL